MATARRTQMIEVAAIAAPLVIVGMTRIAMTPASAAAAAPKNAQVAPVAPQVVASKALTPEQQKAVDWAKSVESGPALVSPLDHPKLVTAVPEVAPSNPGSGTAVVSPEPVAPPGANPLAGLKLTATLRARSGSGMASINGKLFKVGDEIKPGFRLTAIDHGTNSVIVTLADGSTATLGRDGDAVHPPRPAH